MNFLKFLKHRYTTIRHSASERFTTLYQRLRGSAAYAETGFTLIELLVVVLMIGILASIATPSYLSYTQRAHFTEVVTAADALKAGVALCGQENNSFINCDSGTNGIPPSATVSPLGSRIASLGVNDGVITGQGRSPAPADTYVLTPALRADGSVGWTVSGTCVANATC
jgi:type IV pilus assembly protein PilA